MRTSVVPFGDVLPDPPPNRCIARHPRPDNNVVEGSPVQGADSIAASSDIHEPSEFRSAFDSHPDCCGPSLFLGLDGAGVWSSGAD